MFDASLPAARRTRGGRLARTRLGLRAALLLGLAASSLGAQPANIEPADVDSAGVDSAGVESSGGQLEPEAILSIAIDPVASRVIYAGTSGLGLVKSLDAGNSWSSIAPELGGLGIPAVEVHPFTSQLVYVGTRGQGVWLSTSAGVHFEDVSRGLPSAFVRDLAIDPTWARTLYAATSAGVARSDDSGRTWLPLGELTDVRGLEIGGRLDLEECDLARGGAVARRPCSELWATADGAVWRSLTVGLSFVRVLDLETMASLRPETQDLAATGEGGPDSGSSTGDDSPRRQALAAEERLVVRVSKADPRTVYVASSRLGLFRSRNAGASWRYLPPFDGGVLSIAVDPRFAGRLWVGTEQGVFSSRDGGDSFEQIEQGSRLPIEVLEIDPRRPAFVYAGVPGGRLLMRRDDGGWQLAGLRAGQVTSSPTPTASASVDRLDLLPARPLGAPRFGPDVNVMVHEIVADRRFSHVLYAATSRGVYRSQDAGESWQPRRVGVGELAVQALAVEPADSYARWPEEEATLLAGTRGAGILRSRSSGSRWQEANQGLENLDVRAVLLDPHDPDLAWAGTRGGLFRSEDGGRSWRRAFEGLEHPGVRELATGGGELYAATDAGGVYRSPDLGRSWQRLGTVGLEAPRRGWLELGAFGIDPRHLDIKALAVHPEESSTLVAATAFGLFRSTDGGLTWAWTGRFVNASDVAFDPSRPRHLAAATSRGLVLSTDGGGTWSFDARWRQPDVEQREEAAVLSVTILDSGEASGAVLAGSDDGRVLRRRGVDLEPSRSRAGSALGFSRAPRARALEPNVYTPEELARLPREETWRRLRDFVLARLVVASREELLMEDPRLLMLLALEVWLRGEDSLESEVDADAEEALRAVLGHLEWLRGEFRHEADPETIVLDPGGRFAAFGFFWDDGREVRSELRVLELGRVPLHAGEHFPWFGPSRWFKELHDPGRRPVQLTPLWTMANAGRFLTWDVTGSVLATQSGSHELTLWRLLPAEGGGAVAGGAPPSRVIGGFWAPPRAAAFSRVGRHVGVLDAVGRPYLVDLESRASKARPLVSEAPGGGGRHLAMVDAGALSFSHRGEVHFWPLDFDIRREDPELVHEEPRGFEHVETGPAGLWVLAAVEDGGEVAGDLGEMLLFRADAPPTASPQVVGTGAVWRQVRWSGDGRWLALSRTGETELWQLEDEARRVATVSAGSPVRFSPDSRRLQIGDQLFDLEGTVRAYDLARRGSDARLTRPVAVADRRPLWRAFGLDRLRPLWRRPGLVGFGPHREQRVLSSRDGRWLLASGAPWQLHAWHFGDDEMGALVPATGEALLSSRRYHLATSGPSPGEHWPENELPEILQWSGRRLFRSVCNLAGRALTRQEWRRFFGEEPYRATCVPSRVPNP